MVYPNLDVVPPAVYRFQQISDIVYRHKKQQQQQDEDDQEGEEAQSVDMWLLQDSAMAQLMDPQLAAPAVQFLVLEVVLLDPDLPFTYLRACKQLLLDLHPLCISCRQKH